MPAHEMRSSEDVMEMAPRGGQVLYHILHIHTSARSVPAEPTWAPPTDLYEAGEEYVVEMALGGVAPAHVQIRFERNLLHVSGHRPDYGEPGLRCYHLLEIDRGDFFRTVELPGRADPRTARLSFHDGLLVLRVTKSAGSTVHGCWKADSMEGLE